MRAGLPRNGSVAIDRLRTCWHSRSLPRISSIAKQRSVSAILAHPEIASATFLCDDWCSARSGSRGGADCCLRNANGGKPC